MELPERHDLAVLRQSFGSPPATALTEEELLDWLTVRVAEEMRDRPEQLMSRCYTLDLAESAVRDALDPTVRDDDPPFRRLARLLVRRQQDRARSKHAVRVPPLDDDPNAW